MESIKWRGNPKTTATYAAFLSKHHWALGFSPAFLHYSHASNLRAIAEYTAVQAMLEENQKHIKQWKQRVIQNELKKPFFEKLYQLCGREV